MKRPKHHGQHGLDCHICVKVNQENIERLRKDPFDLSLPELENVNRFIYEKGDIKVTRPICGNSDKTHRVDWPRDITLIPAHHVGECAQARAAADAELR